MDGLESDWYSDDDLVFNDGRDDESVSSAESGYNEPTESVSISISDCLENAMKTFAMAKVEELCLQIEDYESFEFNSGWKPLSFAAHLGNPELVEFFIAHETNLGLDINRKLVLAPLILSCSVQNENLGQDYFRCVELFLDAGTDVEFKDLYGVNALMTAAKSSTTEIVQLLLSRGASVNEKDNDGWTPLFYAVNRGDEQIIDLLLKHDANINVLDRRNRYPYSIALDKGFVQFTEILKPATIRASEKAALDDAILRMAAKKDNIVTDTNPRYIHEVSVMVAAVSFGMEQWVPTFLDNNVDLRRFLLLKDHEELKKLGVKFSSHRHALIQRIRQFHMSEWRKQSLGVPQPGEKIDLTVVVSFMANLQRQIYVLRTSFLYFKDEIKKFPHLESLQTKIQKIRSALNNLIGQLQLLKQTADKMNKYWKPKLLAQEIY